MSKRWIAPLAIALLAGCRGDAPTLVQSGASCALRYEQAYVFPGGTVLHLGATATYATCPAPANVTAWTVDGVTYSVAR